MLSKRTRKKPVCLGRMPKDFQALNNLVKAFKRFKKFEPSKKAGELFSTFLRAC
jgi:hypothetical protein